MDKMDGIGKLSQDCIWYSGVLELFSLSLSVSIYF